MEKGRARQADDPSVLSGALSVRLLPLRMDSTAAMEQLESMGFDPVDVRLALQVTPPGPTPRRLQADHPRKRNTTTTRTRRCCTSSATPSRTTTGPLR